MTTRKAFGDRLLIVEDETLDALFVRLLLAEVPGPVDATWVSCLAEALEFVQDKEAVSVLLDLELPGGGLESLEAILTARPGMPVVVLTGYDEEDLGMQAVSVGAQDYLVKGKVTGDLLMRTLRYAAERAEARYATARLAAIVESSEDAIFSTSIDGTIRSWNRGAEHLYGYRADDIVGRSVFLLQPPERRMQSSDLLARMAAGGPIEHFETRHMDNHGSSIDVSLQISPLLEAGNITGVSTIARDVSAHKRAEVALRDSGDRMAEAQRLAHVGSWSVNAASGRRVWSDELYRLLGYEAQEFEPDIERIFDRLHPDDASRVRLAVLSQLSQSEPWEGEFRVVLPGGAIRWLATRTEPFLDRSGAVVGVHGTAQDITDRKVAEEQLRFQAHLLDAVGEAVIATELNGTIIYWGPGAAALYGWSAEEAQGRSIMEMTPAVSRLDEAAGIMGALARGGRWAGVMELGRRDGSTFLAQIADTPVLDEGGRMVAIIGISSDVSVREHASAELARARDEALEASVLKSHFLANMSHEIRTPMNGVLGMTELLLDTALDSRQRGYAETVRASGDALLAIIDDILDLSKIEAGRLELETIDFDLATVIEDVAALLAGPAQTKGLEVVIDIASDVPEAVRGDPGRLRQVLTNLLGNAIKFTVAGHVLVSARMTSSTGTSTTLRLQVEDTGIGIEPDKAARVFEPFAQADSTTTRAYGGTGLGLAITRQLVELMGGRCGLDSRPGAGSTFWVTLTMPLALGAVEARTPAREGVLHGVRALVVDDDETNRVVLHGHLSFWGMEVDVVESGRCALEAMHTAAVASLPYAVALIDMHMPGMDGIQLSTALATDPATAGIPIVLLTSSGDDRDAGPARVADISARLAKPVRRSGLHACLAAIVADAGAESAPASAPAPAVAARAPDRGSVLLAEDNLINRKVAMAMLESGGYRVDAVLDGREALQAVRRSRYDVVLMDCQMPRMDGYAATVAIRAEEGAGRRVPIVAMTAGAMQEDRDRALAAGMDDYLTKPVKKADVLATVGRWAGTA